MGELCIVAGTVASVITQFLKRFPVVSRYPKVMAALLTGAYAYTVGTGWECWLAAFASAIAGYEVIIKPATRGSEE
mgnify:CR=1 FL=1